MKKVTALLLVLMLVFSLAGCTEAPAVVPEQEKTPTLVRVSALKGPTGMGMAGLMRDADKGVTANDYEFTLASAPDDITGSIISGNVDIAAVPTNLASVIYNKTKGGVKLLALNTLGVLYILEDGESVSSIADLKGKTVYASGQGATPEYALNYILDKNGLKPGVDLTVEYKSEHSELATMIISDMADIVLLPEPFVTTVMMKKNTVRKAIDITAEWDAASAGKSALSMGCLVVSSEFAEKNPEAVDAFLKEYAASVNFVNTEVDEAAALIAEYGIVASAYIAKKAIPSCNIVCITGDEMKNATGGFLQVLFDSNPVSVGGKMPEDDFYYGS